MKRSSRISQEGDAVSFSDTDGHRSETCGRRGPHSFGFQGSASGHGARGVVGATGIRLQCVLQTYQRDGCLVMSTNTRLNGELSVLDLLGVHSG